ncbi:MAG: hypothetical protein ACYS0E_05550 [Planctomycetota bacterium]
MVSLVGACGGGGGGGSNSPPSIEILTPVQQFEIPSGGIVQISYRDADPDDVAHTLICADRDGDLGTDSDQIILRSGRFERDGTTQTVSWDTHGAAPGLYLIIGSSSDGDATAVAQAPGAIYVNAPPTVTFVAPAFDVTGALLEVSYIDHDPDDPATTSLFLDRDGDLHTVFDQIKIATDRPHASGSVQTVSHDVSAIPLGGPMRLIAETSDGINPPVYAIATGPVLPFDPVALGVPGAQGPVGTGGPRVATFADGSMVVAGTIGDFFNQYSPPVEFAPGQLVHSVGLLDPFVALYGADGQLAWVRRAGGLGVDQAYDVAACANGDVVVTGHVNDRALFDSVAIDPDGNSAAFVARYDAGGHVRWARGTGGDGAHVGMSVSTFTDGSVVVAGHFTGTIVLGPGESNETRLDSRDAGYDGFVARYDASGRVVWAHGVQGGGNDFADHVVAAGDGSGACLVAGRFTSDLDFGFTGTNDIFLARYLADGTLDWSKAIVGPHLDEANGLAATIDGGCLVTGRCDDEADFDGTRLVSDQVWFVARYKSDGELAWARRGGGQAITAFDDGSYAVAGSLAAGMDLTAYFAPPPGQLDLFVAR